MEGDAARTKLYNILHKASVTSLITGTVILLGLTTYRAKQ